MTTAFHLLTTAAFLCLILAGFSSLVGATGLRERFAKGFAGMLLLAFVGLPTLSMFMREVRENTQELQAHALPSLVLPEGLGSAILVGHLVALVLVIRRYVGVEARKRDAAEHDRARTRERVRLPPVGEGDAS